MRIASIDIGGTFIKSGVLENGNIAHVTQTPTQSDATDVLKTVVSLVEAMGKVDCVGVSTAGEVDNLGNILLCDNIAGYTGMPVAKLLTHKLGVPVLVENDVNSAAIGEYYFGAAQRARNFLLISYGTGIGGAAFINGKLYKGASCSAGEFGGIITHPSQINLQDRGSGSYERYASTSALVKRVQAEFPSLENGQEIFAHINEAKVCALVDQWIMEIAYGLVSLIHAFNPEKIVLCGGIMSQKYILEKINEYLRYLVKPSFQGVEIVLSKTGNAAGMYGAAYLAQQRTEHNL